MTDESPLQHVAQSLMAEAAAQPSWPLAFQLLGLAATEENVVAFRERALSVGIDVEHLRWRRNWDDITGAELRAAVEGARTWSEVLGRLGAKAGGTTFGRLEALGEKLGVRLPPRLRRGPVPNQREAFSCSEDVVRAAYDEARSMADLLRRVGLVPKGDNYRIMRSRLLSMGLDPRRFSGQGWAAGKTLRRRPLEQLLLPGQKVDGPRLAQRLTEAGLLPRKCAMCDCSVWLGRRIPLELDHINGVHDDNRLENLRLLCPNYHALTPTYRGRNVRARRARRLNALPEC